MFNPLIFFIMASYTLLVSLYCDILVNRSVIVDCVAVSEFVNYCRNHNLVVFNGALIQAADGHMFQVLYL